MKITKIEVNNFRILKNLKLDLQDDLSLILGKNNCGKTSLLTILDKFIGSQTAHHPFTWDDFSLSFRNDFLKLINKRSLNEKDLKEFPLGIKSNIFIEYTESDDLSNISSVMMDLEPENRTIILEFVYSISQMKFAELQSDFSKYHQKAKKRRTKDKKEELFSKFMNEELREYFTNQKFSRKFDNTQKVATDIRATIENDKVIKKIINFKSINARRTVSNSDSERSLSKLSSEYYEYTEEDENRKDEIENFKEAIGNTDEKLTTIYKDLFKGVIEKVEKFGGIRPGDSKIAITSTLQQRELLKGNTTVKYDHGNSSLLPENFNGLGYLNLIGMIFEIEVIMAGFRKDTLDTERPADINLLFIEEPEAHTHPQMQYVFIKNIKDILKENCYLNDQKDQIELQTIISTHSSHIVSECDFDDIKYFAIDSENYTQAKNMSDLEMKYKNNPQDKTLGGELQFRFLKQYLTINRSELFFADKAVFIEGDTERILLPTMMRKIDKEHPNTKQLPLLSQNISIVEVGAYSHIFSRFIDFIGVKSLIITDIDPAKTTVSIDDDGIPKKNKDGSDKMSTKGCSATESPTSTTNSALNFFYSQILTKEQNTFDILQTLPFNNKILSKKTIGKSDSEGLEKWITDADGKLMVSYQINEKNDKGTRYQASSFEDSFIHLNQQFIIDNLEIFTSLVNVKKLNEPLMSPYDIANKCIDKKTKFATEILLASNKIEDKYSNWATPKYIEEGLLWLREN